VRIAGRGPVVALGEKLLAHKGVGWSRPRWAGSCSVTRRNLRIGPGAGRSGAARVPPPAVAPGDRRGRCAAQRRWPAGSVSPPSSSPSPPTSDFCALGASRAAIGEAESFYFFFVNFVFVLLEKWPVHPSSARSVRIREWAPGWEGGIGPGFPPSSGPLLAVFRAAAKRPPSLPQPRRILSPRRPGRRGCGAYRDRLQPLPGYRSVRTRSSL